LKRGRRLFASANQIKGNSCLSLAEGLKMVINLLVYADLKSYKEFIKIKRF